MNLMREFDAEGGARVHSRIVMTEKYTPEAREAQERYNISAKDSAHLGTIRRRNQRHLHGHRL